MHARTLKKLALALTFWLAVHMSSLRAQIFTNDLPLHAYTTGANPVNFEFSADGSLVATGNYGVGPSSPLSGAGTEMFWYPGLGAFRAGGVDGTEWDSANIGPYSVAFGFDTTASGYASTASGNYSFATGKNSTALGLWSTASGNYSTAIGTGILASGLYSTAFGNGNTASGSYSTASGYGTTASGAYSASFGLHTTATATNSFVIGTFNVGGGSGSWVATDPLFEIGNGGNGSWGNPAVTHTSDALVVYKDGSATFQGPVTGAAGGDIPMYTGN